MTTQAQGKGKKKNKEVMKVSLDEFNQIDAPQGHSVVSLKVGALDWAETMADYDQQATETQQIIVPAAPRAQRGPGVDYESLPNEPPFRVSLFNLPMSVEEKEVSDRFFQGIDVKRVEITKSNTTVEVGTKDDLYEALCKDGTSIKGRIVSVCLFGQSPQNNYNSDRYGGRGSYGDRYNDRGPGGFGGSRMGDRYGERSGGFNRDRDSYGGGYNRAGSGGFNQQRGGYGDRYQDRNNFRDINRGQYTSGGGEPVSEEPENWRARPTVKAPPPSSYNNGSRQPYTQSRSDPSPYHHAPPHQQQYHHPEPSPHYTPRYNQHHNQPSNNAPYSNYNDRASLNDRPLSSSGAEERPKLVLQKRKTPLHPEDTSPSTRNEAIFGQAKPSSKPYEKMKEVEEKLSAVRISDRKASPGGSQAGSQPGSAPRSRRVSERSRD